MSIAIKRNFTIPSTSAIGASELYLTSSVASTTIGTGALTVAGGAGVSGVISLGGALKLFNGNFYTGFDSAATANTTYIWPATAPSTGTSVLSSDAAGNLSWILMSASGSGLTLNGLNATTQYFSTSIAGSGFTISSIGSTHTYYIGLAGNASTGLISSASQTLFGLKTFASGVAITSGTASTNTTTGDLVVSGGVGIGGTVFTNGLNIQNVFTLGSQVFYPQNTRGFSVNENYNPVGSGASHTAYHFTSGVDRTAIYFDLAISNQYTVMFGTYGSSTGNTFVIGSETANSDFEFRSTVGIQPVRLDLGTLLMRINRSGNVSIPASTASTSTSSGTLTVTGGVGIGGSLWTSSTNFSSISGVGVSNSVVTSGVWSGTAISAVKGGTGIVSYTTGDILYASSSTTLGSIAAGTAGSVLTSAGAGTTPYWAASTGSTLAIAGTNNGDIQYKSAAALGASSALNFDASTSTFKLTGFPIEAVSSSSANVKILGGSVSWNGNINGTMLAINTANTFIGDLFNAQIGGTSRFKVSYTGAVSIGNSYTLPTTDGTANQVLKTNGAGSVSWSDTVISSAQYNIGYYASAGSALTGSSTFTNNTSTNVVSIGHTTASTGFSTGALVVSGGVGIGQTLNVSGNIYQNTNAITAYDTGFRNRIINGDGNIDQRNDGSSTTPVSTANFIDRWKMNIFGSGRLTIGKNYGAVTSPDGFVSYIGMKTTTTTTPGANDYNFLSQIIEGVNTIDLQWGTANAKPVTLSFWAYSSLTGTFGGSVRNAGSGGYNRSYPFTYTISSSNTWEKKTVVIPGDTTGTWTTGYLNGIEIIFVVSNGTTWQAAPFAWVAANATGPNTSLVNLIGTLNATLYLTGIQAEIGSVATPYERRNYGHEFALCQRYYQIVEVRTGGYHTTGGGLRGSACLSTAARPISSPILTVLAIDESINLGSLNANDSFFRGDSFRYIVAVTATGDAYGQWKVSCDTEF